MKKVTNRMKHYIELTEYLATAQRLAYELETQARLSDTVKERSDAYIDGALDETKKLTMTIGRILSRCAYL